MGNAPLMGYVAVFPLMRLGRISRLQQKEVLASQPAPQTLPINSKKTEQVSIKVCRHQTLMV